MFEEQANFGLLATKPLYVDKVIQKIFIEVDEKGSEAAVATGNLKINNLLYMQVITWNVFVRKILANYLHQSKIVRSK